MPFRFKKNNQENNQGPRFSNRIEKIKIILKKVKFVAKNVIYVRSWSRNSRLLEKIKPENNFSTHSRTLNFNQGSIELKIIDDTDKLIHKVKKLRYESFLVNQKKTIMIQMNLINYVTI